MKVQSSPIRELISHKQNSGKLSLNKTPFDELLKEANTFKNSVNLSQENDVVAVGVISEEQPTISDLLINNKEFRGSTWEIIHSENNANKDFGKIPSGTQVYINKKNMELFWQGGVSRVGVKSVGAAMPEIHLQSGYRGEPLARDNSLPGGSSVADASPGKVSLGILGGENVTVSHLLMHNPKYSRDTWKIIKADINRNKAFTAIKEGEEIFINPQNMELSWEKEAPPLIAAENEKKVIGEKIIDAQPEEELRTDDVEQGDDFSSNLVQAVQSYLGKPYREIDCYGLVVRGLRKMGVQYGGRGGLQDQLVKMAKSKGLPENAYMTGEGLIEVSGEKVFSSNLNSVKNVEQIAKNIFNEMVPYLQKGYILSFSTPTRGHTGIVSQHDRTWTFINSGYIDNPLEKSRRARGVGEEVLAQEIKNWCKVAARNGESLKITLGRLQEDKLRTAQRQDGTTGQKIL